MQESIVRRLSFRSPMAMGEAGVERHMLGLLGSGCSARARDAGLRRSGPQGHGSHSPTRSTHQRGGEVSLLERLRKTPAKRGQVQWAHLSPAMRSESRQPCRRGSVALQEANPCGAMWGRPYAACLKPGTCLTRLGKMISLGCILPSACAPRAGLSMCIGTATTLVAIVPNLARGSRTAARGPRLGREDPRFAKWECAPVRLTGCGCTWFDDTDGGP